MDGERREKYNAGSQNRVMQNSDNTQGSCNSWLEGHFKSMRLTNSLLINRSVHKGQDTCKMGADHGRLKGRRRFLSFLEHNGDDIISNVALPFHLDVRINNITEVTQTWCIHRVKKLTQHHQPNQWPPSPELQSPLTSCLPYFPAPSPGSPLLLSQFRPAIPPASPSTEAS